MVAEGLDREGFTLQAILSGDRYRYVSGALNNAWVIAARRKRNCCRAGASRSTGSSPKIFAGLDIKNDLTSPCGPSNRLHGEAVGLRGAINLWFEPTPSTMRAAHASLTSSATGYALRAAYGWRVEEWFCLGPEA